MQIFNAASFILVCQVLVLVVVRVTVLPHRSQGHFVIPKAVYQL